MKQLILFLSLLVAGFSADAANDLVLSQRKADNSGFIQRNVTAVANSPVGFNTSSVPVVLTAFTHNLTTGAVGVAAAGTNQNITLTPSGTGQVISGSPIVTTNTTASTSITTGSGIFGGGVGASGRIYSGLGFYGRRTAGDFLIDILTTTSGSAGLNLTGYGSQTATNASINRSGFIDLWNLDTTNNTFNSISGTDAGGNATSRIAFVNMNDATNEGRLAILTRPASSSLTEVLDVTSAGNLNVLVVGRTVGVKQGTNGKAGTFTLSSGATTLNNTSITANSVLVCWLKTASGVVTALPYATAVSVGASYTIAGGAGDNSTYNYIIFEANP
jgi:hypothetical protein